MSFLKKTLQFLLRALSRRTLGKYKPKVIGITGSVGKTSAKEAIFLVLSEHFRTRRSERNYNNEFGLPFTILGVGSPERNLGHWLGALIKGLMLNLFNHRYPEVLVLEMGVDRIGDMDYLLSIAQPQIGVITNIGISHYEFFKDIAAIENEKGKLAESLGSDGVLIVNADNELALRQKNKTTAKIYSYSASGQQHVNQSDVQLTDPQESLTVDQLATSFQVKTPSKQFSAHINAVGNVHLSAAASAVAVAEALGMDRDAIIKGLENYKPAPGRLNVIAGIKHSVLIDDTYNAAPDSMAEALGILKRFPGAFKMAVLGDMLELGALSDEAHRQVGRKAVELGLNNLITIGPGGRLIAEAARGAGLDRNKILSFDTSGQAKKTVQNLLQPGQVVLIKGSQGVRLEKVTAEVMAEPMRANELLCRQYGKWLKS